jgi:hypothetical protein
MTNFADVGMTLVDGWLDITDDLPPGTPPTLAKADGVGALQFSTARYRSGSLPVFQFSTLQEMLAELRTSRGLGKPDHTGSRTVSDNRVLMADFSPAGETLRIWYVTNGRDLVFATYTGQERDARVTRELEEATAIVESIDFNPETAET